MTTEMTEPKICTSCGETKPIAEFALSNSEREGAARYYPSCRLCNNAKRDLKKHFCTVKMPDGSLEDWVINQKSNLAPYLSKGGKILDIWVQNRSGNKWPSRKDLLNGKLKKAHVKPPIQTEPGDKTGGNNRRRTVPMPEYKTYQSYTRWQDSDTSKALRHNLMLDHEVCEYTGEPKNGCDALHILSRELCRQLGVPHFIIDEDNCVFGLCLINRLMEKKGGHYVASGGSLMVLDKFSPSPTLIKAGAYDTCIVMTPRRKFFANLAMMALEV